MNLMDIDIPKEMTGQPLFEKAKLISHLRQLRSSLARGFAILLLAISVFSSYAVGQSKNQRLQEVEKSYKKSKSGSLKIVG